MLLRHNTNLKIQVQKNRRRTGFAFLLFIAIAVSFILPSYSQEDNAADYYPLKGISEKKFLVETTHPSLSYARKSVHTWRWHAQEQFSGVITVPINNYYKDELIGTRYFYEKEGSVYLVGQKDHRRGILIYIDPPHLEIKRGFRVGDTWSQNLTLEAKNNSGELIGSNILTRDVIVVGKEEDVTVPAGTFPSCFKFEIHTLGQQMDDQLTSIYCKGVGLVKYIKTTLKSAKLVPGIQYTAVLIAYK